MLMELRTRKHISFLKTASLLLKNSPILLFLIEDIPGFLIFIPVIAPDIILIKPLLGKKTVFTKLFLYIATISTEYHSADLTVQDFSYFLTAYLAGGQATSPAVFNFLRQTKNI